RLSCRGSDPSLPGATAARLSLLLDVTNSLVLDCRVGSCQTGEREYAFEHLEALGEGDILLADRGTPSLELFAKIRERGAHFAIRMPGHWKAVKQFLRSGEKEAIVTLPSKKDPSLTMTVRLLKIEREGKSMVVATSLLDATLFPLELFSELYHMRWWNEEWYKEL
ncbi:transposase IS4 family protein, partial [mine drainage metagenome]